MSSGKTLEDHTDEFNKVIIDLENIEVKISDEDQALLFLTSLPQSYEHLLILYYMEEMNCQLKRCLQH